ncbi:DUF5994 family protein [Streptomyces sp. AK02-01A]|uniref:DUF5994 family protein n=1 Tax=Streptomyces sp. AK02-01A TaxID=3028648 RepID=UPI0029B3A9A4|nr:DUF5994 family protein [Streptomyces sp. AK02-01A]MDX3850328.1 DUF5994 family protein [Streptomyces sp. AK02-01A]
MTADLDFPTPSTPDADTVSEQPGEDALARLFLAPGGHSTGALDGAWWPRSRDLARELPALAVAMDGPWGRITRVLVNPTHWPVVPRTIQLPERALHIGWFAAEQDPDMIILRSYSVGRWDLLVIPPETSATAAARLMTAAAAPDNRLTASALLARETPAEDADKPIRTEQKEEARAS